MSIIPSIATAISYITTVVLGKKKIPNSISAMVYDMPRNHQYIWILWMWIVAFTAGIPLIDKLQNLEGLGFATMASLTFCGAMPLVKKEKNTLHNIFGITAGILSQICVAVLNPVWLSVWAVMAALFVGHKIKPNSKISKLLTEKGTFIAECLCALSLYGSLI